jgi:8-oxo-dGTP pyrophosphatase MutT (NUDIX family)
MVKNLRSYGLIIKNQKILVCNEIINNFHATKFPGGGVKRNENPKEALKREIYEELSLECNIKLLLYSPGTLLSPWNNKLYTPIYYHVETKGRLLVPENEKLTIEFLFPEEILNKDNIAKPEKKALKNLLELNLI